MSLQVGGPHNILLSSYPRLDCDYGGIFVDITIITHGPATAVPIRPLLIRMILK